MKMAGMKSNKRVERCLEVLFGGKVPKNIPPLYWNIAECLAIPELLPERIEDIVKDEGIEDIRLALARVQIDSELRNREDVEYFSRRLWVAQTIERMVFGGLMVEGEKLKGQDEDDE
jgi:hypothetical protein